VVAGLTALALTSLLTLVGDVVANGLQRLVGLGELLLYRWTALLQRVEHQPKLRTRHTLALAAPCALFSQPSLDLLELADNSLNEVEHDIVASLGEKLANDRHDIATKLLRRRRRWRNRSRRG
jgi:hypothetical protein